MGLQSSWNWLQNLIFGRQQQLVPADVPDKKAKKYQSPAKRKHVNKVTAPVRKARSPKQQGRKLK